MLAKIWKKLLLAICIIACIYNVMSKLVNRTSLEENLNSANDGNVVFEMFKKDDTVTLNNSIKSNNTVSTNETEEKAITDGVNNTKNEVLEENNSTENDTSIIQANVETTEENNDNPQEEQNNENNEENGEEKKSQGVKFSDYVIY